MVTMLDVYCKNRLSLTPPPLGDFSGAAEKLDANSSLRRFGGTECSAKACSQVAKKVSVVS